MERRKKRENSGFYIALCCCAVIIAAVGYAGRISLIEEEPEIAKIEEPTPVPAPTGIPKVAKAVEKEPEKQEVNNNVVIEEPTTFIVPVDGKVVAEYSGDDLVYNEALKDWRAHSGVDFSAKTGEEVRASADGIVEEVFDSEMGRCVTVNHKDGFVTMYANLDEDTLLKKGEAVRKGDKIGYVGNTALGDITEGEHLHFEIIKEGKNVNPTDFLE